MGRALSGLFATIIVATTLFALNLFFVAIAGVLRLVPTLVPLIGRFIWGVLVLSCRLYYLLLNRIAPFIERRFRIKILHGLWRLAATLLMSLTLGVTFLLLAQMPFSIWTVTPCVLHGLFVDFVWDEIPGMGELQMGIRL
jgi:hypothetical protein